MKRNTKTTTAQDTPTAEPPAASLWGALMHLDEMLREQLAFNILMTDRLALEVIATDVATPLSEQSLCGFMTLRRSLSEQLSAAMDQAYDAARRMREM